MKNQIIYLNIVNEGNFLLNLINLFMITKYIDMNNVQKFNFLFLFLDLYLNCLLKINYFFFHI
jgi:hypothetical protein